MRGVCAIIFHPLADHADHEEQQEPQGEQTGPVHRLCHDRIRLRCRGHLRFPGHCRRARSGAHPADRLRLYHSRCHQRHHRAHDVRAAHVSVAHHLVCHALIACQSLVRRQAPPQARLSHHERHFLAVLSGHTAGGRGAFYGHLPRWRHLWLSAHLHHPNKNTPHLSLFQLQISKELQLILSSEQFNAQSGACRVQRH